MLTLYRCFKLRVRLTVPNQTLLCVLCYVQAVSVVRTITHSAFGGLISARDFTDLVINEKTDDYLSTNGKTDRQIHTYLHTYIQLDKQTSRQTHRQVPSRQARYYAFH